MKAALVFLRQCLTIVFLHGALELGCLAQHEQQPGGQTQRQPKIQLRLMGRRKKESEGRLEVYYSGEWGTVCDDEFSIAGANIACREMGFMDAVTWAPGAKYGQGEGRVWLDNVRCLGIESSIAHCPSNGWGVTDCRHSEDVGLVCSESRIPGFRFTNTLPNHIEDGLVQVDDVRVRGVFGSSRKRVPVKEGYVEVKEGGVWKQICNTGWTFNSSRVICGMFGFPAEKHFNAKVYKMFARRRHYTYWPYTVHCTGSEAHLTGCAIGLSAVDTNNTCESRMPVVVSCVAGQTFASSSSDGFQQAYRTEQPLVRLKGGGKIGEGRVEVLKNGEWGTVCDDQWTLVSASVICRELGFGSAKEALTGARLGKGIGSVHMNEVVSTGFVGKSITDCSFNQESLCNHKEDAAVRCNVPTMGFENQIRLAGGRTPLEGRVEVLAKRNGTLRWGTVCNEGWSTVEALVVCRQLGLGFADHAIQETWFWEGDETADQVVMSGLKCSGTELSLFHCKHHGEELNCPNDGGRFAAGISCTETASDLVLNPQVVEETTYLEIRPLIMLQCAFEEECLASTANDMPRMTGFRKLLRFSSQIHNNGQADFRPKLGRHSWIWHECHRHYHSMEVFTHYDFLTLNGSKVAEGHKASFCLEDTQCDSEDQKNYECANFGEQGITVSCWDTYRHDIDCQWIDISDVPPGEYILQVVINPNYEVAESDYTNNVMKCRCKYDGHRVWTYNCHTGGSLSDATEEKFDHFPGLLNNQLASW
eukprot:gi/632983019/ref/XP_007908441.1/ PREDICTED: LOW QUALITY PROTEIN: lysyl oxidase homolog 2-like [Callorhinchus milii]